MHLTVSLYPEKLSIFGVNVGLSTVMAYIVTAILIVVLIIFNRKIKHFQDVPRGLQNVLELVVDGVHRFAVGKIGHYAESVAPVTLMLMVLVAANSLVELFGLPAATSDLNCTVALGLFVFGMVNFVSFRALGVKGRLKGMCRPMAVVFPIKLLTDLIYPFSMGIRLFSNILVGNVIMQLIYLMCPYVLPAVVASYFNVLHVGIQTFVFGLLSLIYVSEAVE